MTDIAGDMGTGGGGGVPGSVERQYVADKGPLLNTTGSINLEGDLYYTNKSANVEAPELQLYNGVNQVSSNALTWGSTSSYVLNNRPFYLGVWLYQQLQTRDKILAKGS